MTPAERIEVMQERLEQAFSPSELYIQDDSAKHKGHAGAAGGAGHYTIQIKSNHFKNKTRIVVHREIYQLFSDLIPNDIHALSIKFES